MNCTEIQELLHGYFDDELDLVHSLEVERHLEGCTTCAGTLAAQERLRSAFRRPALYRRASADLAERIHRSIESANRPASMSRPRWRGVAGLAASLAVAAFVGWMLGHWRPASAPEDQLALAVLTSHVRSLQPSHLLDVRSSDQHQVKPWFRGLVDFSPSVVDLSSQGYSLEGGRLDYLFNRNVIALVYKRRQHVINLFIWPSDSPFTEQVLERQGYHIIGWMQGGLNYWAVSDLNQTELAEFVKLIREKG
jgi:anti-sigma factor RsiW